MEAVKPPKFDDKTVEEFNIETEQQSDDMNCCGKGGAEMEIRCPDSQNLQVGETYEEPYSTIEENQETDTEAG